MIHIAWVSCVCVFSHKQSIPSLIAAMIVGVGWIVYTFVMAKLNMSYTSLLVYYTISILISDKGSLWWYAQSAVHSRVVSGAVLVPLASHTEQCLRQQCLLQRWWFWRIDVWIKVSWFFQLFWINKCKQSLQFPYYLSF